MKISGLFFITFLLSFTFGWFGHEILTHNFHTDVSTSLQREVKEDFQTLENYNYYSSDKDGKLALSLSFPNFNGDSVINKINCSIKKTIISNIFPEIEGYEGYLPINSIAESGFINLNQNRSELKQNWEINSKVTNLLNNDKLISIEYYNFQFTGGAHGNESIIYNLYSKTTGDTISPLSILSISGKSSLKKIAEKEFRKQNKIKKNSDLNDAGFWFKDGYTLAENIGISKSGIILHYNSYEIAPYSMGPIEIVVPFDIVEPLLKTEYKNIFKI